MPPYPKSTPSIRGHSSTAASIPPSTPSPSKRKPYTTPLQERKKTLAGLVREHVEFLKELRGSRTPYSVENVLKLDDEGQYHIIGSEPGEPKKPPPNTKYPKLYELPDSVPLPPGVVAERVEHPLVIDKFPFVVKPPDQWAQDINKRMADAGLDYLPALPFVALVVASINSGKSNLVAHWLSALINIGRPQNVTMCAKTAHLDPLLSSIIHRKPPEGVHVSLWTHNPLRLAQEDMAAVSHQLLPQLEAVREGKFRSDKLKRFDQLFYPDASLQHPFLDEEGKRLPYEPIFPEHLMQRQFNPMLQTLRTLEDHMYSHKNNMLPIHAKHTPAKSWAAIKHADVQTALLNPGEFRMPEDAPMGARMALWNSNPLRTAANIAERPISFPQFQTRKLLKEPFNGRVMFIEDGVGTFDADPAAWEEFVSIIRHMRNSFVVCIQKLTKLKTMIRAQCTDLFLFPMQSGRERFKIIEEFSGSVPDFEAIWDYCCTPTKSMPKPFMYMSFRDGHIPRIMKCFTERVFSAQQTTAPGGSPASTIDPSCVSRSSYR